MHFLSDMQFSQLQMQNLPLPALFLQLRVLRISHYYIAGDQFAVPFREFVSVCAAAPNLEELWAYNPGSAGGARHPYPLAKLRRLKFEEVCGVDEDLLFPYEEVKFV